MAVLTSLVACGGGVTSDVDGSVDGSAAHDGGMTGTDGGMTGTDGGMTGTDGGMTGTDGGMTGTDGGMTGTDSGTACADDGNPCTVDGTDGTGACAHLPSDMLCLPGGHCDVTAGCMYPTGCDPATCDDSNPCTIDGCASGGSAMCAHTVNLGATCDDGMATTSSDHCVSMGTGGGPPTGVCRGSPISCDDMNPCTIDALDSTTGMCSHPPTDQPCTDHDPCTTRDSCNAGTCVGHMPLVCSGVGEACCSSTGTCLPVAMCIAP